MLSLEKEIERILKQTGDYDRFMKDDQFSRTYQLNDNDLVIAKNSKAITVNFMKNCFQYELLPYYPGWYPILVMHSNEVISIVIKFENSNAYSARNWQRFKDLDKDIAARISGISAEVTEQGPEQHKEETVFEQLSLW